MTENNKAQALIITRIFDAPREKVWKAWTNPEQFKKWWGPEGFTAPTAKMDVRVGGKYLHAMHGPAGTQFDKDFWSTGAYKEVVEPEKLVFSDSFADEKGNAVPATHYGMSEGYPLEMQITVSFEDQGGKTKMTLRHEGHPGGQESEAAEAGWNGSFDKLAQSLR